MNNLDVTCTKSEKNESGAMYGRFLFTPLNRGQGITIGNLLRRILLNDIGSIAITGVRISGIRDEFSTIPGTREDVLEILLNLKGVVLKNNNIDKDTNIEFGHLKVEGPAVITASQIKLPTNFEIVNSNHYIATISDSSSLEIEFRLEYGTGYKLADQALSNDSQDFLQTDAIFMPVQQVDFKIENIYTNSNDIKEKLIISLWTNGSITPENAILTASRFIINLFNCLLDTEFSQKVKNSQTNNPSSKTKNPYTNIAIEELHLSVRAYNCLKRAQINTIGDLLAYSPEKLQELKNFGRKSADEVFTSLKNKLGIILT